MPRVNTLSALLWNWKGFHLHMKTKIKSRSVFLAPVTEVCVCFIPRDLSNNQISEIAPDAFHGLRALNSLWVTQIVSVCVCVHRCVHMSVLCQSIPPYVCTACMCICASVDLNNSEVAPALCKQLPYEISGLRNNHSRRPAALCVYTSVYMCVYVSVLICQHWLSVKTSEGSTREIRVLLLNW